MHEERNEMRSAVRNHMHGMTLDEMETVALGAKMAANKPDQKLRIQYIQEFLDEQRQQQEIPNGP